MMSSTLILQDRPTVNRPNDAKMLTREIRFAASLDYDSIPEDDLADLELDHTSVLTSETEARLFRQMNLAYYRAATERASWQRENAGEGALANVSACLQRGDAIRNELLVIFHKLTVSIAKHFVAPRHSLEELVSEGDATLLRAITLFDPGRGFRFSTYATHALRRRFGRYVGSAAHVQSTPVDFREAPPIPDRRRWTLSYERAMNAGTKWLESALYELPARDRYIVRCRYGWGREFEPRTLQDIAEELGISRERVRQLETRAMKKLQAIANHVDLIDV
jgi:RNA polymerase primary sigma factor